MPQRHEDWLAATFSPEERAQIEADGKRLLDEIEERSRERAMVLNAAKLVWTTTSAGIATSVTVARVDGSTVVMRRPWDAFKLRGTKRQRVAGE